MKSIFSTLLLASFGVFAFVGYKALNPCASPLQYSIGEFDPQFGVSKNDFIKKIMSAESVWEKSQNKNFFDYNPDAKFKINLIYEDGLKKVYNSDASFSINLVKASILQRVFLLPNYINLKILEELTVIVVIAAIVFVIIVILTFRNRKDEIK